MIFDWTVTLGNVLTIVGIVFGGVIALLSMKADLRIIGIRVERAEFDLKGITASLERLASVLVQIAQHDEKIRSIDQRITKLEDRGRA